MGLQKQNVTFYLVLVLMDNALPEGMMSMFF